MVYKKGQGFSWNGRDFNFKNFGVKCFGGQYVFGGMIIVCQCGIKFQVGQNVKCGGDDMFFVFVEGIVEFCNCGCFGMFVNVNLVE